MITLEKVEALRQRTGADFAAAKAALEAADGNLEAAAASLENQKQASDGGRPFKEKEPQDTESRGKARAKTQAEPQGEAQTETRREPRTEAGQKSGPDQSREDGAGFHESEIKSFLRQVLSFVLHLIRMGNRNQFEIWKNGANVLSVSLTVLALLAILFFWAVIPCLVLGLFLGCSYRLIGPDFRQFP